MKTRTARGGRIHAARRGVARLSISVAAAAVAAAFGSVPEPALAQASAVQVDIAPQPLGRALLQLGEQASLQIFFSQEIVQGLTSPALKGAMAPDEALRRLLAGTGIEFRRSGKNVSLTRPAAAGSTQLEAVKVVGVRDTMTEGSGSYAAQAATTSTKLVLSPRETPQTITVVTRQQMDDFGMTTVDEALKSTSGVYVWNRGANGNEYLSRGFGMQVQYDGIMDPIGIGSSNRAPLTDNAFIDHVEVLQGPSGLLSGAGEPGGTINLVRKRPTREFQAHAEAQGGSWNRRRLVGDVSGPLLESGAVRGRLVALADDGDSFIDHAYNDKRGVYGVVEADLGPTTTLSASVQYQRDKGLSQIGVPMAADGSDLGLSRSSFFGNANGYAIKDDTLYTVGIKQVLPQDWTFNATYTHRKSKVNESLGSFIWGDTLDTATGDGLQLYQYRHLIREFRSQAFDAYVSGPVSLFGRRHELVFGVNGSQMRDASMNSGSWATPINIYSFNPNALPEPPGALDPLPDFSKASQHGFFGVGRFSLSDNLKLIAGSRFSWYEAKDSDGVTTQKESGEISPYAGLIYDIDERYSVYASYTDIFKPQSEKSVDGSTLKPVVGANYEVGVKGELLDGRLNVSAALFRLEQTNLAKADDSVPFDPGNACGGTCYVAQDKVTSQGVDLGLNGEVAAGWDMFAGYTYTRSKYATGEQSGMRYGSDMPQHSFRFATQYQVPGTAWRVGGNVRVRSKIYLTGDGYRIQQGGLVLVGLTAQYRFNKQAEVGFVVDNLFDRKYYEGIEGLYYNSYGAPRSFSMNFKYRF